MRPPVPAAAFTLKLPQAIQRVKFNRFKSSRIPAIPCLAALKTSLQTVLCLIFFLRSF